MHILCLELYTCLYNAPSSKAIYIVPFTFYAISYIYLTIKLNLTCLILFHIHLEYELSKMHYSNLKENTFVIKRGRARKHYMSFFFSGRSYVT